jgi:hypothetical protein
MSSSEERWNQIAAELRAYRKAQDEVWGDLDDITLASYIAGVSTPAETARVEQLKQDKPAVGRLIHLVAEIIQPVWVEAPAPSAQATVSVLRNCLSVWLDEVQRLVARGAGLLMGEPEPVLAAVPLDGPLDQSQDAASAPSEEPESGARRRKECLWKIPVEDLPCWLTIRARPTQAEHWELGLEITSDEEPELAQQARFSLSQPDDIPVVQAAVAKYAGRYVELSGGRWDLTITIGEQVCVLPLELGAAPPGS